jgi:hypothetical protein
MAYTQVLSFSVVAVGMKSGFGIVMNSGLAWSWVLG